MLIAHSDKLIESIYDAACDPSAWGDVLNLLASVTESSCANLSGWEKHTNKKLFHAASRDYVLTREFLDYYVNLDPRKSTAQKLPAGSIYRCHEHIDEEYVRCSEFYQDYALKQNRRYLMAAHLSKTERVSSFICLHRGSEQGAFTESQLATFERLMPHLKRAAQINARLEQSEVAEGLALSTLNSMPLGVFIVDREARVLQSNRSGEELLASNDGLRTRNSCLDAGYAQDGVQLLAAVRTATEPGHGVGREGASILVSRESGLRPYRVIVAPLSDSIRSRFDQAGRPAALVLVSDPENVALPSPEHLSQLFGFTRTEADIAMRLAGGNSLEEIAAERGSGLATVRSQIKAILQKTETHRQSELIRAILTVPVTAAAEPHTAVERRVRRA